MSESNSLIVDPDQNTELSAEEALRKEKIIFQQLVSSADPTPQNLQQAWTDYLEYTRIRNDISEPSNGGIPTVAETTFKFADLRVRKLNGESVEFTPTEKSASAGLFLGDTVGVLGGQRGVLLRDLNDEQFAKADSFCRQLSRFGIE